MRFTERLWSASADVFAAILAHPFLRGLSDGTLPEEAFRFYVVQDSHYLKDFARGLALLGAKADDDDALTLFCQHSANAIAVERALHAGFFGHWGLAAADVAATPVAPNCLFYTSYLLRTAYERPWHEGLGAFLPCYWIYAAVGRELERRGSPHPLYRQWIDTYAGDQFAAIVDAVKQVVDTAAAQLTEQQRDAAERRYLTAAKMEYLFWDMGWHRQPWPV